MSSITISTGEISFEVPNAGKPCHTWYKVVGDVKASIPLILLHGGPGSGHNYFLPLQDLAKHHGIPLVMYDQIGCGKSTRLRERAGDVGFWTMDLFLDELDNLIDYLGIRSGFYLLGHSWGGMMAGVYAARQPEGLKKVILSSTPASMALFAVGTKKLLKQLPQGVQDALEECEREGDHESERWEQASMEFYTRFICRLDPWPQGLLEGIQNLKDDTTVYNTMYAIATPSKAGASTDISSGKARPSSSALGL